MILTTLSEFQKFLSAPNQKRLNVPFGSNLKRFLSLYVIGLLLIILVMFIQESLKEFLGTDKLSHAMMQPMKWQLLLILAVIVAPLIEEFIFRFFLKYERNYLLRFISYVFPIELERFWQKTLLFWVYVSSITFGLIHYFNFSGEVKYLIPTVIILTLPQLILGFILAFIRLKMGFTWAIAFHALWNGVLMGLMVLFLHKGISSSTQTEDYSLSLEKHFFKQDLAKEVRQKTTEDGLITFIEAENQTVGSLFRQIFDKESDIKNSPYWNTINLRLEAEMGIPKAELEKILKEEIEKKSNPMY